MIGRTLILAGRILILAAAVAAMAGFAAAAPVARADSPNDEMRARVMVIRGLIDRSGAADFFLYPTPSQIRPAYLGASWWPRDPWTGERMRSGRSRGHFRYVVSSSRRRYRLVGYLDGGVIVLSGGMPRTIMLAYDHRGEEGLNLIREHVEDWARNNGGLYPPAAEVAADGAVGLQPHRAYWPSNPWDHRVMVQRHDHGSFSYVVAPDRTSYTLRLHRALKNDYVLSGAAVDDPWSLLLASLEDEILSRSGRILSGYVDQWSLQHDGALPPADEFAPDGAVGAAHADWPSDPIGGGAMHPGSAPGTYGYHPGASGAYVLDIHLHSGEYAAGGTAPSPAAPARGFGTTEL